MLSHARGSCHFAHCYFFPPSSHFLCTFLSAVLVLPAPNPIMYGCMICLSQNMAATFGAVPVAWLVTGDRPGIAGEHPSGPFAALGCAKTSAATPASLCGQVLSAVTFLRLFDWDRDHARPLAAVGVGCPPFLLVCMHGWRFCLRPPGTFGGPCHHT